MGSTAEAGLTKSQLQKSSDKRVETRDRERRTVQCCSSSRSPSLGELRTLCHRCARKTDGGVAGRACGRRHSTTMARMPHYYGSAVV